MLLEDSKTLGDCGFTNQTARPQAPATVGLAFRINGQFPFIFCLPSHRDVFVTCICLMCVLVSQMMLSSH